LLSPALRGARRSAAPASRLPSALVIGGGGALGSALLGEALVTGRFARVSALVGAPLASALRAFEPLSEAALLGGNVGGAKLAFIVYERSRHANGRDEAFVQPVPAELPTLARALRAGGVQRLVVVVPHAPALLPQALQAGFASHDEAEVAALGFEHLVFLRTAQPSDGRSVGSALHRFAAWWLSQLRWMVPTQQQPVRALRLAELVVTLGRLLPRAAPGTRVLRSELLRQATQGDAEQVLGSWLVPMPHDAEGG
jgi:hypothetical protein